MKLKPVRYIQIDDQKGALYSAGKQSLLVPVTFIKTLNSTFVRLVGKEGANILIYKIGEAVGRGYAQSLESILKKEKTTLSQKAKIKMSCNAVFMEAGWGRVEIREINLAKHLLEAKLTYCPSRELLEKSDYSLEKGILAGIYREISQEKISGELVSENVDEHSVILRTIKESPADGKDREKIVLVTRKKLEQMVEQKTEALQKKINELEKFHKLTVGREVRMIELKQQIKKLKKGQIGIIRPEELPKTISSNKLQNCWDFWKCDEKVKNDCPAYKTDSGRECWLSATNYCPYLKKEFKTCDECPWFKKVDSQVK